MTRRATPLLLGLALACHPRAPTVPPYRLELAVDDARLRRQLTDDVAAGRARVEAFFGAPFARPFTVRAFADRAQLDLHWGRLWHEPDLHTECWMVGMGMADELSILSPARWRDQACEHDPDDADELALLVAHELVHTYHSQRNATVEDDAVAAEAMAWFVEGVAVFASDQLDRGHQAPAIEAIRAGAAPARLADAWAGRYRYGVSGSLVAYVDATAGRAAIVAMLAARTPAELLALTGLDEPTLLERWRAWELARHPDR